MTTDQAQQHAAHGIERLAQPPQSRIRRTIAVMSGKGGVGKSTVTALLAVALANAGKKVGILDADITGPSIPRLFGVKTEPVAMPIGLVPPESRLKIRIMSVNLLLPSEDDPVVWRGPIIAGTVRQFWSEVVWGELDYLLVDLPPGTGDAPLTVMQSLPLDGIVVVTSPQELSVMVVKKAVKMASMLNVPLFGLLENMSYVSCPDCGRRIELFGPSHAKEAAESMGLAFLGSMPIDPQLTVLADRGAIEDYQLPLAAELAADIDRAVNRD